MGKGNGEHPPQKFVHDQYFCEIFVMVFAVGSITICSLSIGMDDGGSFPYQYAFTGFIMGPILFVNLISRILVLRSLNKKTLNRKNILDILNNSPFGNILWPWSCRIGMMWCIPSLILTGLGGVNCGVEEKDGETKVKNTCYYNIEGTHGTMYRGMAISLVCIYAFSFVFLMLSLCPIQTVLDQIKVDPISPAKKSTATKTTPGPAAQENQSASSTSGGATNNASSGGATNNAATGSATASATSGGAKGGAEASIELKRMKEELDRKTKQIEEREQRLEAKERKANEANVLPVLPSYNELMGETENV